MNDCATNPDNVAILYASGHGIQMSPDDGGIVLLEDFREAQNVLDHSLDVGAVRKGMAGPTMAQRQFYFVDACRVRPEEAVQFQTPGNGVGLPAMFEGRATVSPVFFAGHPEHGGARRGRRRDAPAGAARVPRHRARRRRPRAGRTASWAVTTTTLMQQLKKRVLQLAEAHGAQQIATTGGQMDDVPFHVLPGKPEVPITIQLDPESAEAAACARARPGIRSTWRSSTERHSRRRSRAMSPYRCARGHHPAADAALRRRPALPRARAPALVHRRREGAGVNTTAPTVT